MSLKLISVNKKLPERLMQRNGTIYPRCFIYRAYSFKKNKIKQQKLHDKKSHL